MGNQKINYLLRSFANMGQKKECPFCHQSNLQKIDTKFFVTQLLKCDNCGLSHRHPKDDEKWLRKFYQSEYSIDVHMMTDIPNDEELAQLKKDRFPLLRSFDPYISAMLPDGAKIIDFGCSWGYNVFKLNASGYNAEGYELSKPRGSFGMDKLGVKIHDKLDHMPKDRDLVMSSHVIEHLSNIPEFIDFAKSHLKEDGIFMAFCPNGNDAYRQREPDIWHVNWGFLHPNFLDVDFGKKAFKNNPYIILTDDWDFNCKLIARWDGKSQVVGEKQDGKELLIIAKPNIQI